MNDAKQKPLQKAQPTNPRISRDDDGLQVVQAAVGPDVQRHGEEPGGAAQATTEIVVSPNQKIAGVRLPNGGSRFAQIVAPANRLVAESRNIAIAADYGGITVEQQAEFSGLPVKLVKIADRFLEANDLLVCRHDPEFWESFGYLIGPAESISIEAVIEAISMCVVECR